MPRVWLVTVLGVVIGAGCAAVPPAQVGQTAGTIAGAAIAPGIGAPLGSLVGLAVGMLFQKQMDRVTETRERQELGGQLAARSPTPGAPEPAPSLGGATRVWVDERLQDGRLIAGHFDARDM